MQAVLSSRNIIGESNALECEGIVAIHSAPDRLQVVRRVHDGPSVLRSVAALDPDLVAEGLISRLITGQFEVRPRTIEVHRHNIQRNLGVHTVAELVKFTTRHELAQL